MPAVQPRPESPASARSVVPSAIAPQAHDAPASSSSVARLADELAVPAPSPVHQLQAELVQLTVSPEAEADQLYPGWFRLAFPLASSLLLWAAILWGASHLA